MSPLASHAPKGHQSIYMSGAKFLTRTCHGDVLAYLSEFAVVARALKLCAEHRLLRKTKGILK
jgi:hypothetical protein